MPVLGPSMELDQDGDKFGGSGEYALHCNGTYTNILTLENDLLILEDRNRPHFAGYSHTIELWCIDHGYCCYEIAVRELDLDHLQITYATLQRQVHDDHPRP